MNRDQHIVKILRPPDRPGLLRSRRFGVLLHHIKLPTVALTVTVVLATGCSSTGAGFSARLLSPVPTNQQAANFAGDGSYQPARSPVFSDYLGG